LVQNDVSFNSNKTFQRYERLTKRNGKIFLFIGVENLRKYIIGAVFGALLMLSTTAFANKPLMEIKAWLWPTPIQINVNGLLTTSNPDEVQVLNYNDQAYVPLRYVAEKLGATVNFKPEGTDWVHLNGNRITIDSADNQGLTVKDQDGIIALGNFQFIPKHGGTMLTFQMKQNKELPAEKPFLNLSFFDRQHKLIYSQAVTLSFYAHGKGGVQTLFVQLDALVPTLDASQITATLSHDAVIGELPGRLIPLTESTYILQIVMTDAQYGWAKGDGTVLRTTDGGKTWLIATPQGLQLYGAGSSIANHDSAFVGNHAWVAKPPISYYEESEVTVWHTDNGGQTWKRATLPITENWEQSSSALMNFIDEKNGFVFLASRDGENRKYSIYSTSDGGNQWTRVAEVTGLGFFTQRGISFLDSHNGWIATGNRLMHTTDGGKNWTAMSITLPSAYNQYRCYLDIAPQFFGTDPQVGFLQVPISSSQGSLVLLYVTRDGGKTWNPSGENVVSDSEEMKIIDDHTVYMLSRKKAKNNFKYQLYLTENAGQTWTLKSEFDIPSLQNLYTWQFLNLSDGWISDAYPGKVFGTHDGGLTWTQLRSPK
jgi:photosystem II stability/assembly factor-like uncharacterized protein